MSKFKNHDDLQFDLAVVELANTYASKAGLRNPPNFVPTPE